MSINNRYFVLTAHTISLICLGLGLFKYLIQIDISAHYIITLPLFSEKKSIITALESLWDSYNYWPFILIFLFGIVVPLVKAVVIYYLLLNKSPKPFLANFVSLISKWAMADVFAMSIFVAFLGARAMENTQAVLLSGFYWFAAYVIISGIISMLVSSKKFLKPKEG
jgi:uncharacterized paraquat-inducible protein A